jgi:hypothetical protein
MVLVLWCERPSREKKVSRTRRETKERRAGQETNSSFGLLASELHKKEDETVCEGEKRDWASALKSTRKEAYEEDSQDDKTKRKVIQMSLQPKMCFERLRVARYSDPFE